MLELRCITHPVDEKRQAKHSMFTAARARVLLRQDIILRVRHQAKNRTAAVANAGDGVLRPVRIPWVLDFIGGR